MRHGTQYGYRIGCRCDECKAAKSAADKVSHAKHRAERVAAIRRYTAADPDRNRARARAWGRANRARALERVRAWEANNPERARALHKLHGDVRRARKLATTIPFTTEQLAQRLSMYPGCWVCGGLKQEVDHVKPLAAGGIHALCNLRPICLPCNRRKSSRWPFAA